MGISERGGALLTVLWLSAALSAIAFSIANTVRGETERTSTSVDGLRAYYLASGGIHQATLHMLWARQVPNLAAKYYNNGTPVLRFSYPSGLVEVEVIPEAAKWNINLIGRGDLLRLLGALGVERGPAEGIAAGILDYRTQGPGGAPPEAFYLPLGPSFRARRSSIEEIEELLLLRGMTPDLYYGTYELQEQRLIPRGGFADCVSVFGATDQFDANTAQPAVMLAAGVPLETVNAIVARRAAAPFRNREQLNALGPATGRLRIGGNSIYTLRATARLTLPNGGLSDLRRTVAAMVKFMPAGYDAPYHILRWHDTVFPR